MQKIIELKRSLQVCSLVLQAVLIQFCHGQDASAITNHISDEKLRGHIQFLADDLLEGRGPATTGDRIAQLYLETQFRTLGLKPLDSLNGYRQPFPMLGLSSTADPTWEIVKKGERAGVSFKYHDDYIAVAGSPEPKINIEAAEIVFVGYGIQAPEYQWDDFKGQNLKGKILLMMNNDPEADPKLFEGARRLYYGRWDYKYESAARQGAAGAIIIHTEHSAGYPFTVIQTSWTGEQFELRDSQSDRMEMKAWMTRQATDKLVAHAGLSLSELLEKAESRDFKPVPLGVTLSTSISCVARQSETANVVGAIQGSDPKLANEYVVFMAHHDHIGSTATRDENDDNIYNGAIDNASGTAALLAIADAIRSSGLKSRRSILFAAVGAEEQGLLGSKYFAEHPPVPNGKQSAVVNIDGINFLGPTRDVQVVGFGKSSLDLLVDQVAKKQQRVVVPDREPSKGYYYRSDQFSLAKVGVPGLYLHAGHEVIGKPEGWGKSQLDVWTKKDYHQRSDEYNPDWDLSGAIVDIQLLAEVGWIAANQNDMQKWNPGDEFEAARKASIAEAAKLK